MSQTLLAEEFIFTTLSAKHSPSRRGGYQFVYVAPGLSETDREAIMQKVGAFHGALGDPPRWQFFSLPDQRCVVTRSQAIAPDVDLSDRRGGYLAYGLVISAAEFATAAFDPFRVLDVIDFPETAQDTVSRYGIGNNAPAKIELRPAPPGGPVEPWSGSALRGLLSLTLAAEELIAARCTVLFHGAAAARLNALRLALQIAPQTSRVACTFDTEGDSHLARTGGLWAVGLAEPPGEAVSHPRVDANHQEVHGRIPQPTPHSKASLYGRWFEWVTSQEEVSRPFSPTLASTVEMLAACIDSQAPFPEGMELDEGACRDLEKLWGQEVRTSLYRRLAHDTSEAIATAILPWLAGELSGPARFSFAAGAPATAADLGAQLAAWLFESTPKLASREWQKLSDLGLQCSSPLLTILAGALGGREDKEEYVEALATLDAPAFNGLLTLCPERVAPKTFVSSPHAPALVDWAAGCSLDDDILLELIEALIVSHHGAHLERLSDQVLQMSDRSLRRHHRWLSKRPGEPCPWRRRLDDRIALATSRPSWWRRLLPGGRSSAPDND